MIIKIIIFSFFSDCTHFIIISACVSSKFPVGSSKRSILGFPIIALEIASLCFSPPLIFLTFSFFNSNIFNFSNASSALETLQFRVSVKFSNTVKFSINLKSWKTIWISSLLVLSHILFEKSLVFLLSMLYFPS